MEEPLTFLDLFCGIGGFRIALQNKGCLCLASSEIDEHCISVYRNNFNDSPLGDITNINENEVPCCDIVCGGFPCQPFSKSGKQCGFNDCTRGTLFFDICRIIKHTKPKYIILENVKNLYTHDSGNTWKTIYNCMLNLNYNTYIKPIIFNTLFLGIPQNRERVFILAKRNDLGSLPEFPTYKKENTCIYDVLEDEHNISANILKHVSMNTEQIGLIDIWNKLVLHFKLHNIKLPTFPIWTEEWNKTYNISDIPKWKQNFIKSNRKLYIDNTCFLENWLHEAKQNKLFTGSKAKFEWQCGVFQPNDDMWNLLFQYRPSGIRVKRPNYSPSLVAMAQIVYVGIRKRKLTPREVSRLQSFPGTFKIHENPQIAYKQFGNSVNVKVVEHIVDVFIRGT